MLTRNFGTIIAFLSLITPPGSQAQNMVAGIDAGVATFAMKDLKALQIELQNELPIDGRIVSEFPPYLLYGGHFTLSGDRHFYRGVIGHTSTGGRIHYSDYSGSFSLDQLARMTYFGGQAGLKVSGEGEGIQVFVGALILNYFNTLKFVTKQVIFDENNTEVLKFNSLNVALGPFLEAQKKVNHFLVKIQASYEIHVTGKLHMADREDHYLIDSSNTAVKFNADGLRISAGIGYTIR